MAFLSVSLKDLKTLGLIAFPKILADLFLCLKRHFFRKQKALIKKVREDISLTENLRRLQVFRTDIPPKQSVGCPVVSCLIKKSTETQLSNLWLSPKGSLSFHMKDQFNTDK